MISAVANGLRAAVATLIPLFLASRLGHPELSWMALGGWLGTLCDPGGPRSTRLRSLAAFALAGAVLVPLGESSARWPMAATIVLALVAFAVTLARALGPAAATVGTMTAVVTAVATAAPRTGAHALDALAFAAGAAWATVLSSVVWSTGEHRPVRRAIARIFGALSAYAWDLARGLEVEDGLAHQRRIRASIEEALATSLAVRSRRAGESAVGADLRILIGRAEAQFPQLIAIGEELAARSSSDRAEVARILRALSSTYLAVARNVTSRAATREQTPALPTAAKPAGAASRLAEHLALDAEHVRALAGAIGTGSAAHDEAASPEPALARLRDDLRQLRDALSFRSTFFRHAVRVAIAAAFASLLGHRFAAQPHWVTVTTLAVLQPYPGPTSARAFERVLGTVFGSLVAAIIGTTVRAPLALAAVMFPLSVAAVATRPRSYRLFTFFLTPVFVLIAERHPGDWWTAAARAGDACIGGVVALLAAVAIWPSWERTRLPNALDEVVRAVTAYRDLVLGAIGRDYDETAAREIARARRAAGIALGEAETSLERFIAEPLRQKREAEDAMQLITHARRLTNACTALDSRAAARIEGERERAMHLDAIATYGSFLAR